MHREGEGGRSATAALAAYGIASPRADTPAQGRSALFLLGLALAELLIQDKQAHIVIANPL